MIWRIGECFLFIFLLSVELLPEYRRVTLRPRMKSLNGFKEDEVDAILSEIVVNGIMRDAPEVSPRTLGMGQITYGLWFQFSLERYW